jgi:putative membrane protein
MDTYHLVLFLHVVLVATWFGGISLMAMVLRDAVRSNHSETMAHAIDRAQRWNLTMFLPCAVLALITGVYMLLTWHDHALWLIVKERFGSLFVILYILFVALYGRKALKQVKSAGIETTQAQKILKRYIMILNLSLLCMAVLIFFVTTKIR